MATLEVHLEGEYRKYSNNDGQVSGTRNTPQAFSHWTYEKSQHDFVIIDIQGVNDIYTDPQVHTKDHKGFGIGNLGQKGIVKFLITHQCNAICKYLKLPNTQERYLHDKSSSSSNLLSKSVVAIDKGTMAFPKHVVDLLEFDKETGLIDILDQFIPSASQKLVFFLPNCILTFLRI